MAPKLLSIILLTVFFCGVSFAAKTYKWTDENGTVHYVDSIGKLPREKRNEMQKKEEKQLKESLKWAESQPKRKRRPGDAVKTDKGEAESKGKTKEKAEKQTGEKKETADDEKTVKWKKQKLGSSKKEAQEEDAETKKLRDEHKKQTSIADAFKGVVKKDKDGKK